MLLSGEMLTAKIRHTIIQEYVTLLTKSSERKFEQSRRDSRQKTLILRVFWILSLRLVEQTLNPRTWEGSENSCKFVGGREGRG